MSNSRHYVVTLETPSWGDEADGVRRLRAMLKRLARGYGLRCVSAEPAQPSKNPLPETNPRRPLAAAGDVT